jgi:hypothetical protein
LPGARKSTGCYDKRFDDLVEKICQFDGICIVDTGATTFVPLWNYILENEILCFLAARSRRVFVHSVVAGGQAMSDTLNGLERRDSPSGAQGPSPHAERRSSQEAASSKPMFRGGVSGEGEGVI